MTRSRLTRPVVRCWALLLLLALGGGSAAHAEQALADDSTTATVAMPASNWPWTLGLLVGGITLGVVGARLWARKVTAVVRAVATKPVPQSGVEPTPKKPAENVARTPVVQSLHRVQGSSSTQEAPSSSLSNQAGKGKKPNPNFNSRTTASLGQSSPWPVIPHRPVNINETPNPLEAHEQLLETDKTIDWVLPLSTSLTIQQLVDTKSGDKILTVNNMIDSPASLPRKSTVPPVTQSIKNTDIIIGQEGWSIPPTKPYSHEAPLE